MLDLFLLMIGTIFFLAAYLASQPGVATMMRNGTY